MRPYRPQFLQLLGNGGPAAIAARKAKAGNTVLVSSDIMVHYHPLFRAIIADGKRRNLHWRLAEGDDAIVPLKRDPLDEQIEEEIGETSTPRARTLRPPARYILSFQDHQEARRFVREWHKRSLPVPEKKQPRPGAELPPVINAEILW